MSRTDIILWFWDTFFWIYDISPSQNGTDTDSDKEQDIADTYSTQQIILLTFCTWATLVYRRSQWVDKTRHSILLNTLPHLTVSYFQVWNYAAVGGERQTYYHQYSDTLGIVTRLQAEQSGVQFLAWVGDFSLLQTPRPAFGLTHPPIQWVPEFISTGVKVPGAWGWWRTSV
jgi:hypothetical protein